VESIILVFIKNKIMEVDILENLGLSHSEAKIYLALLKNGSSKSGSIIKSANLQSSTVYHVLNALVEKGLATYIFKSKIKYYQAEKPETFLKILEEKKQKLESILPSLKEKESIGKSNQSAKVYEGFNGIKTAFSNVRDELKKDEEYYVFQINDKKIATKKIINFLRKHHQKRSEKGIKVKILISKKLRSESKIIFKDIKNTQIRYVNELLPSGIVYKNKFLTLDWEDIPTTFVIESNAIAKAYKKLFEDRWAHAKR
jgi:HTH-type transcriptional regulator, sugar sensing transcriptional regulator